MNIIFESREYDGHRMCDWTVARVRFAMLRLSTVVPCAKVQFSDINGPHGGVDKRCQVEIGTDAAGTVVISSLASDWRAALNRSLTRATRVLSHSLQHSQKPLRRRSAKLSVDS